MNTSPRMLSARQAAEALGISLPTLYSYVSRGLIRSEAADSAVRARRYSADDVEALRERRDVRRDPARAAQGALNFGMPVLDSAITLIEDGRLYYRGYDAIGLAQQRAVESVAALIWLDRFNPGELFAGRWRTHGRTAARAANPITRYQTALARAETEDLAAYNTAPEAVAATGARILRLLVAESGGAPGGLSLAQDLQEAWALAGPDAAGLISAALILCADHELNVSAFTARCVASAGSTPYAVVIAGLAALQGHRHGGHIARVSALLHAAQSDPKRAVADYLARGDALPGFGHPLYPDGDPRGRLLLDMAQARRPQSPELALARALCEAAHQALGVRPTIDFALAVVGRVYGLPTDAPLSLFALGRTIGWIGHAIEQYASDQLIRPRARYVGARGRADAGRADAGRAGQAG